MGACRKWSVSIIKEDIKSFCLNVIDLILLVITYIDKNEIVTVDVKSRLRTDDIFILASQATQVYYAPNVKSPRNSWYTVVTTKSLPLDELVKPDTAYQENVSNVRTTLVSERNIEFVLEEVPIADEEETDKENEASNEEEEGEGEGEGEEEEVSNDDDGFDTVE